MGYDWPSERQRCAERVCLRAKGKWNGKQTLLAYVLAVESMHQIARLTMPRLSEQGWHTTLAYGVFGAAIPAVRLFGLNEDKCANALGIAVSRAGGVRANFRNTN